MRNLNFFRLLLFQVFSLFFLLKLDFHELKLHKQASEQAIARGLFCMWAIFRWSAPANIFSKHSFYRFFLFFDHLLQKCYRYYFFDLMPLPFFYLYEDTGFYFYEWDTFFTYWHILHNIAGTRTFFFFFFSSRPN